MFVDAKTHNRNRRVSVHQLDYCTEANQCNRDLSKCDVSSVSNMHGMFFSHLLSMRTSLEVGRVQCNQDDQDVQMNLILRREFLPLDPPRR